jgi:hypothetical protein
MESTNIGILMFGDPTRKGAIKSEVKFLKNLHITNPNCNFYIITTSYSLKKKIIKQQDECYNFPFKFIDYHDMDYKKINGLSGIITYPGHSSFYGGCIAPSLVRVYKLLSYATNILDIPVFTRVNDSEIKVRDYKKLVDHRWKGEEQKLHSNFLTDQNYKQREAIEAIDPINYNNMYWLANGSAEAYDWVHETLYTRENEEYRMCEPELIKKNTIYLSDDLFFLIHENYARFDGRMWNKNNGKLCYIGFFDTVNTSRASVFKKLFKENRHNVDIKIFGKGTQALHKLNQYNNIDVEEGYIEGDSDEYFNFLNHHLAYIFIGKGKGQARYIGKTAYDAMVARTPILVYKPADEAMITFDDDRYYFSNEEELKVLTNLLKMPKQRAAAIKWQRKQILKRIAPNDFKFESLCKPTNVEVQTDQPRTVFEW